MQQLRMEAEAFLLANGLISEDLEFLYFVEVMEDADGACKHMCGTVELSEKEAEVLGPDMDGYRRNN